MKERKLCLIWALLIQCCFFSSVLVFQGVQFLPDYYFFRELKKAEYDRFMKAGVGLSDFQQNALGVFEILEYIFYIGSVMILLYLFFSKSKGIYTALSWKIGISSAGLLIYFVLQLIVSFYIPADRYRYYMTMIPLAIISLVIIVLALVGRRSERY